MMLIAITLYKLKNLYHSQVLSRFQLQLIGPQFSLGAIMFSLIIISIFLLLQSNIQSIYADFIYSILL